MAYFNEVYLKRVNKFGPNLQTRVQNKKEHDFEVFKEKSVNRVNIFINDNLFDGVLQTKKTNEDETINYLLVSKKLKWFDGTIVTTQAITNKQERKNWLIFHLDEYTSIGYNRYQIVLLDREISWIENGLVKSSPMKLIGSKNKSIKNSFNIEFGISGTYIPNKVLNMVIPTQGGLTRNTRIKIGDEVWKISGIDKISVPGVSYITLEENYIDKEEKEMVDENTLQNWSIQSTSGKTIHLQCNENKTIEFYAYYGNELREEELVSKVVDDRTAVYKDGVIRGIQNGTTELIVYLKDNPKIYNSFLIIVDDVDKEEFSIIGPDNIVITTFEEYAIINDKEYYTYESLNGCIEISYANSILTVKGKYIGKDEILVKDNGNIIYSKPVSVTSLWMED